MNECFSHTVYSIETFTASINVIRQEGLLLTLNLFSLRCTKSLGSWKQHGPAPHAGVDREKVPQHSPGKFRPKKGQKFSKRLQQFPIPESFDAWNQTPFFPLERAAQQQYCDMRGAGSDGANTMQESRGNNRVSH